MTQEYCTAPRVERKDRAPIGEWLLHYVDLMQSDLKQHANPIGLNRAVKNRALQQRIAEVRAYLSREAS